jgi:chromate transport protein ChrA
MAWLIIGFYWIVLTVLVVPVRLHRSPLHDAAMLGLFPVAAALVLRFLDRGSRRAQAGRDAPTWTHRVAVGLLLTWPLAWAALILLGKSLL